MNILVTGGLGFIGSNLVDRLIELGNEVYVIDNLSTGLESNKNENANYYYSDITNFIESNESLKRIIEKYSIKIVYHLAALSNIRETIKNPNFAYMTNLLSSVAISDACLKTDVEKLIFASTSAVYGEPDYLPVDEIHSTEPISPYGLSKLAVEQYLNSLGSICEMDRIVFRLPNVYGPRQRSDLEGGVIAIFYNKMKNAEKIIFYGDGKQTRDWVHVFDIVNALTMIIDMAEVNFQIISLGSGKKHSLWNLFESLSDFLGYELSPILDERRKGDIQHMIMSGEKAENLLNWKTKIDLKHGLKIME